MSDVPKTWADQPFALISETGINTRPDIPANHTAIGCARKMALIHNIIIRGLNALYNQCLGVQTSTSDVSDFLLFGQVFYETLHHHHQLEETFFFPELEKMTDVKGLMDRNVQEHKDFEEGLEQFREYVFKTNADAYDGMTLKAILDNLGPTLEKHLHGEIKTLLDLSLYDSQKLLDLWGRAEKIAKTTQDKYRVVPFVIGCGDRTFSVDDKQLRFPEVPFFVPYLVKFILQKPLAGTWRFTPCDFFGYPKPLPFLNPAAAS